MNKDERIASLTAKLTPTERAERLWAKGAFLDLPIYRAPATLLYLNDDNRRFRAEAQAAAADLGRVLDSANEVDEKSIICLLLDSDPRVDGDRLIGKPSKETKALLTDWDKRGQEKPFWIRPDGLVINGNRRLAMIKREQAHRGEEFYDWVQVIVFPEDEYDSDVLFDLEAREQLTEGLKVRYSDINILLTLRDAAEAHEVDWTNSASVKSIAALIQHLVNNDPAYAEIQLNAIKYMDLYLEYIEKPDEYYHLQGMVERFREVGKTMSWIADEDASREDAMLNVVFAAVQAGSTHLDLRDLRALLKSDPDEFDRTIGYIRELENETDIEDQEEEASGEEQEDFDPEILTADDEDDEEEVEATPASVPASPRYPKPAVKRVIDTAVQGVRDAKRKDKRQHVFSAAQRLAVISADDLQPYLASGAEAERLRAAIVVIVQWSDGVRNLVVTEDGG